MKTHDLNGPLPHLSQPAMSEEEYRIRLCDLCRADLLRLCRAAGFTAHKLTTTEQLIHLLWAKVGQQATERFTEQVNKALSNLGCEVKP